MINLSACIKRRRKAHRQMNLRLTGYFEYRNGRIIGWVNSHPYLKILWIDVVRRGITIASTQATQPHPQGRFEFLVIVGDMFPANELLNESVRVVAHSANGDMGTLLVDGSSQLEIIRKFYGPAVDTLVDIDFSDGGNSLDFVRQGWTPPGRDYTLTLDDDSVLELPPILQNGRYLIRIVSGALIFKPAIPGQSLTIFINDMAVTGFYFEIAEPKFVEAAFDSSPFVHRGPLLMRLHHPDAFRPKDYYKNIEARRIGLSMKKLEVVRLLTTNTPDQV